MQLYVINLDRSPDRMAHINNVFEALGLKLTRISAIDGKNIDPLEFAHWTRERRWPQPLTPAELGCFLSHRQCLEMGLESGAPYFAIFEDDVELSPQAPHFLKDFGWIAAGTDIVKLDTASIPCLTQPLRKTHFTPYQLGRLISKHYCTGGYIVSSEAAKRLLQVTKQAFAPIDEIYFNPDCGILPTLNVQQLVPAVVIQAGLKSTIRHAPPTHSRIAPSRQRSLTQKLKKEGQRFYRRRWRPFWCKWLKGYYWGEIPFS